MQQAFVISLFLVVAFIASAVIGDFFFLVLTPLAALGLGWWLGSRYSELRPSGSWIGLLPGAFWLFTFFQEWSRGWRGARELIAYDRAKVPGPCSSSRFQP